MVKMTSRFLWVASLFVALTPSIHVSAETGASIDSTIASFESTASVAPEVAVPTVVEVPVFDPAFRKGDFVVYEETTGTFQPSLYRERISSKPKAVGAIADAPPSLGQVSALVDRSYDSWVEFPVSYSAEGNVVRLTLSSAADPLVATGLLLSLERYAAPPRFVEVSAIAADGTERIVLAKQAVFGSSIRFPKTTSRVFSVTFWYAQPLRMSELSFFDEGALRLEGRSVRFLARPGERYSIFFRSDRTSDVSVGESPNLFDDADVKRLVEPSVSSNRRFRPADSDGDGVKNTSDNCVNESNPDQIDENGNGRGDVCDDYDKDGILNGKDNCPSHPNRNQSDADGDGVGDACDTEESRVFERYAWLPWAAIVIATTVVSGLFVLTIKRKR